MIYSIMSLKKTITKSFNKNNKKSENTILNDTNEDSNEDLNEESESDSDEESNENSDRESDENSDEENTETKIINKKEKSKKLTHEEIFLEINKILEAEITLENEISELEKILISKIKLRSTYRKNRNKYIGLLPKAYLDGINKARKEKKKRTSNNKSGILAEHPIPPILLKFLELPENTLLMRPKVFSLLNNKFKELGLKKGQDTILDKKTAKLFGVNEGYVIKFQECQKFLADIYDKANSKTTEVIL